MINQFFNRISSRSMASRGLRAYSQLSKMQPKTTASQWTNQVTNANLFLKGSALQVNWKNGETSEFLATWLRYNCPTNRCEQSNDRTKMAATAVTVDEKVKNIYHKVDSNILRVDFESGHSSEFDCSWLWRNSYQGQRCYRETSTEIREWKAKKTDALPECGSLQDLLETSEGKWDVLKSINEYGFAVIDATADEDPASAAERASERIAGRLQQTNFDRIFDVISKLQFPMNAAYTSCGLDIHQDLQVWESPPGLQLLHCLENDEDLITGGESTLVDLFAVAERMRSEHPEAFKILSTVPVTFERINEVSHYRYTVPHFSINPVDGTINQVRWYPFSEAPLVSLETAKEVREYYEAYEVFTNLLAGDKHTVDFRLKKGQMVVFNNRRMGHGRREFVQSTGAERHLRGTYMNIDDFGSEFRTMINERAEETGELTPFYPVGNNSY